MPPAPPASSQSQCIDSPSQCPALLTVPSITLGHGLTMSMSHRLPEATWGWGGCILWELKIDEQFLCARHPPWGEALSSSSSPRLYPTTSKSGNQHVGEVEPWNISRLGICLEIGAHLECVKSLVQPPYHRFPFLQPPQAKN